MVTSHQLILSRKERNSQMIFKHLIGIVNFKATGDNIIHFLNEIKNADFMCKNIHTKNNEIYGTVYRDKFKQVSEIALHNHMNLEIVSSKGLIMRIIPYKKRLGIIAGIILSLTFIFIISNFTLKIRITGCNEKLYPEVYSVLEINGIYPGQYIPSMDFDTIEQNIVLAIKDIAWVSIRNSGGIITVNVNEVTKRPDMIRNRLPSNVIADKDAQIINMEVYAGESKVQIGEGVKKGDLLISGFVANSEGKSAYYYSQGIIIGQYRENFCVSQNFNENIKIESDETMRRRYINFFALKIPISLKSKPKGEFVYDEKNSNINFLNIKLPLGICNASYKPYNTVNKTYDDKEVNDILNKKVEVYEKNFLSDTKIITKNLKVTKDKDKITYNIDYIVQGEIGKTTEILAKK